MHRKDIAKFQFALCVCCAQTANLMKAFHRAAASGGQQPLCQRPHQRGRQQPLGELSQKTGAQEQIRQDPEWRRSGRAPTARPTRCSRRQAPAPRDWAAAAASWKKAPSAQPPGRPGGRSGGSAGRRAGRKRSQRRTRTAGRAPRSGRRLQRPPAGRGRKRRRNTHFAAPAARAPGREARSAGQRERGQATATARHGRCQTRRRPAR